ncbi:hypothetical protein PsorP6_000131 [Peronosclerospora sorghi]|uniref:Uncharacterized protein n=1 Tax=Peronosclerospora sorghi TaxID=230839 RepID=A0ACC0WUU3_9STRA|nr:hypothetical protein PsorP6_000131 [Peronosclerospora sorghi]
MLTLFAPLYYREISKIHPDAPSSLQKTSYVDSSSPPTEQVLSPRIKHYYRTRLLQVCSWHLFLPCREKAQKAEAQSIPFHIVQVIVSGGRGSADYPGVLAFQTQCQTSLPPWLDQ